PSWCWVPPPTPRGRGRWSPRSPASSSAGCAFPSPSCRATCPMKTSRAWPRLRQSMNKMILVGQYDSPYVRRVAVSLRLLGFSYEHDTRSVFGDFDSMLRTTPLGRIPSLILPGGETLIDSAAILDWLDETVGPGRA